MLERIKEVSEAARIASVHKLEGCHSQLGEDLVLKYIAKELGINPGNFVDIGASDGISMSNSYLFRELGWAVFAFDGNYQNDLVEKQYFSLQNSYHPFKNLAHIDILSIDIDGQDYWILKSILDNWGFPHIICLEVNGCIQQDTPVTVPLNDNFKHDATDYYGANLPAFKQLLKDYTLVLHHHSQNAFFVHHSFNCPEYTEPMIRSQYHPHSPDREWVHAYESGSR